MKQREQAARQAFPWQRMAAVGLVSLQALALGLLMGAWTVAWSVLTIAFGALWAHQRRLLLNLPGDRWILVLLGVFGLKFYFAPQEFSFEQSFLLTEFAYEVALFCLVVELVFLYRWQNVERLPTSFLLFALVGLIFTGDARLTPLLRTLMLGLVQFFLVCWVWYSNSTRRMLPTQYQRADYWRWGVMAGVLVVAAGIGTMASVMLHRHERALENIIAGYLSLGDRGPARSGFSNRGGLSDVTYWRENSADEITLQIRSPREPGYLRGRVFDQFANDRWLSSDSSQQLFPNEEITLPKHSIPGAHAYFLPATLGRLTATAEDTQTSTEQARWMEVWPIDPEIAGHCFAPLDAIAIACRTRPIAVDSSKIVLRPNERQVASYGVLIPTSVAGSRKVAAGPRQEMTATGLFDYRFLDVDLDPRIESLATELFAGTATTQEKIAAVETFFQSQFQYQLGIQIPRGEDRLAYFLTHRLPAHCEYFATATAILLRLADVPTRYVTGYVAREQNPVDGRWLARRKDAHAWVEAYDEQTATWVIVESTPGDGVPVPAEYSVWDYRREALQHRFRMFQDLLQSGFYFSALWLVVQSVLWVAAITGLCWGLILLLRRIPRWFSRSAQATPVFIPELETERERMDQVLARLSFSRATNETLCDFAERIEANCSHPQAAELASWYRDYSQCRYRLRYYASDLGRLRHSRQKLAMLLLQSPRKNHAPSLREQ